GHRTVVCDGDSVYVNSTGNPGMASGGMGDVLTGVLAALMAQGMTAFEAACLAVAVHGQAGDLCAARIGQIGVCAGGVAQFLPESLMRQCCPRLGFAQT